MRYAPIQHDILLPTYRDERTHATGTLTRHFLPVFQIAKTMGRRAHNDQVTYPRSMLPFCSSDDLPFRQMEIRTVTKNGFWFLEMFKRVLCCLYVQASFTTVDADAAPRRDDVLQNARLVQINPHPSHVHPVTYSYWQTVCRAFICDGT
jgi:hypothetical protein